MLSKIEEAIILAGGLGTRLRTSVPNLPKPLAPINNKAFLELLMNYWIKQGIKHFVLSVGYMHEKIVDYFGDNYRNIPIDYAIESSPLGTGGGLLLGLTKLKNRNDCLVINGDTFFEVNLNSLEKFHFSNESDWTIALFNCHHNNRYMGIKLDDFNQVQSLESDQSYLSNGGVYLTNPDRINALNFKPKTIISLEKDILTKLLKIQGRLFGMVCKSQFIDIGVPEDYEKAQHTLQHLHL
jgi:D-glycero-alpha-D-manno-heptose 1-phosphate guanylyltransferase